MSPMVYDYTTGVCIDGAKQSAQRIIKTDDKNCCAERLKIYRYKTHPEFFASSNHKNGDEQDDEIAFEPEESSERFQRRHVFVLSDLLALFKSLRDESCGGFSFAAGAHRP